jgi:CBS domain-containing protein
MGVVHRLEKGISNSEKFITIYNELDTYMRKVLNIDESVTHSELIRIMSKKNKVFKRDFDDLKAFSRLRNAIVHNPDNRNANPIAEPHDYIVNKYEDIKNKVINPPVALNTIAIKSKDIFTTTMDANALNVMQEMNRNSYTHVPVVQDGKLIGVFSENTVFSYLVKNQLFLNCNIKCNTF